MLRELKTLLIFTGSGVEFLFLLLLRCPFDAAMTVVNATFLQHAFNAVTQNDSTQLTSLCLIFGLASLCLFLYNGTVWSIYAPFVTRMENALLELKQLGFSLSEIKKLLDGGMSNEQFMEALVYKKMAWQNTIASAENKMHSIDKITERMSTSESATKMHELSEEERAWLLVKMVCVEDLHGQSVLSEAIWL